MIDDDRRAEALDDGEPERRRALAAAARAEVSRCRARRRLLGADLYAEPAWDMLLVLYLADDAARRVSASALCTAAAIPTTSALRWIRFLERAGLPVRERDRSDARRTFTDLTPLARAKLELLLCHADDDAG